MSAGEFRWEVEVPGTPEEVWRAIATGPGISSWLHDTTVDAEAGTFAFDMGSGEHEGRITGWDPPRRFVQETEWGTSDPRTLVAEWTVETAGAGRCVVRLVVSGFGSGADWEDELDGFSAAMREALEQLGRYLRDFRGQEAAEFVAAGRRPGPLDEAFDGVLAALGVAGGRVDHADPPLAGAVELRGDGRTRRDAVVRLEAPAPGHAIVSVFTQARRVEVRAFLFGEDAAAVAAREGPRWQAWLSERFPPGDVGT
jgi:uncharacterized protein YndB with AHSA1/START domain